MPFAGEIEVDESYFAGRRKGKRGLEPAGKVPVFGILKCGGAGVYKSDSGYESQDVNGHEAGADHSR